MTEDVKTQQAVRDTKNKAETCREGNTVETYVEAERARPEFNRYIYLCCSQHKQVNVRGGVMLIRAEYQRRGAVFRAPELT